MEEIILEVCKDVLSPKALPEVASDISYAFFNLKEFVHSTRSALEVLAKVVAEGENSLKKLMKRLCKIKDLQRS